MTLPLDPAQLQFLAGHHHAAMITVRADGTPHVAQVGVGLVEGPDGTQRLWSSGTQGRLRTRHLRRDPRCTLFVFNPPMRWLGLETTVTILEGPDAPGFIPACSAPSWACGRSRQSPGATGRRRTRRSSP